MYIYEHKDWPNFTWRVEALAEILAKLSFEQGRLLGEMSGIGFDVRKQSTLNNLSQEIIKSSEIEGQTLQMEQVRSSVAKRLNIPLKSKARPSHYVDGIVDMMIDATQNFAKPLTAERLFAWHSTLFPTGRSGMYEIEVGKFRSDKDGRMQVVSERGPRKTVHFEAPKAAKLFKETNKFFTFINSRPADLFSVAIAHIWFVTLHPFEDGNGRIARAITEMLLARCENSDCRFYSMSNQIQIERNRYYEILEQTQKGTLDITEWLHWFFSALHRAIVDAGKKSERVLEKARFWQNVSDVALNENQHKILNRLFDGFEGNLTSSKWAKICKCSQDTANREINDLLEKNILKKIGNGRSTHYLMPNNV